MRRTLGLTLLKITVTGALLYWLLANLDLPAFVQTLKQANWQLVALALALHLLAVSLGGVRWWLLLQHTVSRSPLRVVFVGYYIGILFNNLLPSGMGGDAVRVLYLSRRGLSARALLGSTIMDRGIGLFTVILMGLGGMLLSTHIPLQAVDKFMLWGLLGVVILGVLLLFSDWLNNTLKHLRRYWPHSRLYNAMLDVVGLCHSYQHSVGLLIAALGLTILMQGLVILVYYYLGHSIGLVLPLLGYVVIIPIVFLSLSLPISVGGLGVREGVLTGLLMSFQVAQQPAISLSLLFLFILWISSLPGLILFFIAKAHKVQNNGLDPV